MRVGDEGTIITLTTDITVDGATTAEIRYKKPSGVVGSLTATPDGSNVVYTTTGDDFDEDGAWELQAYVDIETWAGSSTIAKLTVHPILV